MFTNRKRLAAAASALALGGVLVLGGSGPANALTGGSLPSGSTICTDLTRSDRGIYFYGFALANSASAPVWSVRTSATAGGQETEVLRLPTQEPISTNLTWSGTLFYRICLVQTLPVPVRAVKVRVNVPPAGNPGYGIGPHTATLGAGGTACGEVGIAPLRLVGTSTVPVRWTVPVQNGDGQRLRTVDLGTSTTIDRLLPPGEDEIVEACVTNTSSTTATLSFDFLPA